MTIKGLGKPKDATTGPNKAAHELGRTILKGFFSQNELDSIRSNIKHSQNVVGTGYGVALIHAFAGRGATSVVKLLIDKGADINAEDDKKMTPLIRAVICRHEETVTLLLDKGANLESKFDGNTALIEAAMQNHERIVKRLLEKGAEKEAKNTKGHTALHIAAANAYVKVVQALLDAGANINTKDNKKLTPLMSAALCKKLWMVILLLERGADVEAQDKDGETALTLHQNKEARKTMSMTELYGRRNTPLAKLLKHEMSRQRRMKNTKPGKSHPRSYSIDSLSFDFDRLQMLEG